MFLVDTHAHLDHIRFAEDRKQVLDRARDAGVGLIVTVADDLESARAAVNLADENPSVFAAVGVHPHDAAGAAPGYLAEVRRLALRPRVVAVGEIGLDYHYDFSPRPVQREVFAAQLDLAAEVGLPVVVHSRQATADTFALLREARWTGAVMHCFGGDWEAARSFLELGCYISLAGVVTFKGAAALCEVARKVPEDRLLLETDAPYLAPAPRRGHRNEPGYLYHTAAFVAGLRGVSLERLAEITTANARAFFNLEGQGR
ncbi:MAG: TatD family hydrolase [Candidatus Desulforudis sp.]|nr:TatD family hydrolase [Desulforudis sp.]